MAQWITRSWTGPWVGIWTSWFQLPTGAPEATQELLQLCCHLIPGGYHFFESGGEWQPQWLNYWNETDYLCLMCLCMKSLLFFSLVFTVISEIISNSAPIICRYLITSAIITPESLLFLACLAGDDWISTFRLINELLKLIYIIISYPKRLL